MSTDKELRERYEQWGKRVAFYPILDQLTDNFCFRAYEAGHAEAQAEIEALREQLSYELPRARRSIDVLELQLRHTESQKERLTRILAGIHALLYPSDMHVDGKVFRLAPPQDDANKWMHALSERICAIPDEIDAAMASWS